MPYKLMPKNSKNEFCVQNTETGENKGCSATRAMAVKHMRALYAAESGAKMRNKEISDFTLEDWQRVDQLVLESMEGYTKETGDKFDEEEVKSIFSTYSGDAVEVYQPYYGATSYEEIDDIKAAEEKAAEISSDVWKLPTLVSNILGSTEIDDKGSAIRDLADELATRITADDEEDDSKEKAKREDVSAADKKRAVAEYGNVTYADPTNKKYPIDTAEHIRAAWNYIHQAKNAAKYPDKGAAIKRRIVAAWKRVIDKAGPPSAKELNLVEQFTSTVKELIAPLLPKEPELLIFKNKDDQWMWFARYSNNYRDRDDPPEIISKQSHLRFAEMVEKGLAPYPEIRLWHLPQWRFGKATWVGCDETANGSVFALAAGTVNKGFEQVAEYLSKVKEVRVSHGMPPSSIKRDPDDPTVIIEHVTTEISPLPAWAAANELTGFNMTTKEAPMPIPDDKKKALITQWGFPETLLDQVEQMNADTAKEAAQAGLEKKETAAEVVGTEIAATQTETPAVKTPAAEKPAEETTTEETVVEGATARHIISAVAEVLEPIAKQVRAQSDIIKAQGELIETITKELTALKKGEEEKVKETIAQTPMASLSALLAQRVIGNPVAAVSKEDDLAKSKPKETAPASASQPTIVPFLNEMITGRRP